MKLTIFTLPFIFSVAAIANPLPEDVKPVPDGLTAAASVTCTITGDGVRYRRCPKTNCEAVGQYAKGTRVTFTCYTTGDTVGTTSFWDKTTAGYYVTEAYIDPDCAATVTTPC